MRRKSEEEQRKEWRGDKNEKKKTKEKRKGKVGVNK